MKLHTMSPEYAERWRDELEGAAPDPVESQGYFTAHPLAKVYDVRLAKQQLEAGIFQREALAALDVVATAAQGRVDASKSMAEMASRLDAGQYRALPKLDRLTYQSDVAAERQNLERNLSEGLSELVDFKLYTAAGEEGEGGARRGHDGPLYWALAPDASKMLAGLGHSLQEIGQLSMTTMDEAKEATARLANVRPVVEGLSGQVYDTLGQVAERAQLLSKLKDAEHYPADVTSGYEKFLMQAQQAGRQITNQGVAAALLHQIPMGHALELLAR